MAKRELYGIRLSESEHALLVELGDGKLARGIRRAAHIIQGLHVLAESDAPMTLGEALASTKKLVSMDA